MREENIGNYPHLYISIQQALLGEVNIDLRGVAFEWKEEKIIIYFYYDGIASEEVVENYSNIGAYVVGNYNNPVTVEEKILEWPSSKSLPNHKHWAYQRKEEI